MKDESDEISRLGWYHLPKISTIWAEIPRTLSVKRSVRNRGGVRQWVALGPIPTILGDSVERSKHALAEAEMTNKTESDKRLRIGWIY